MSVPPGARPAAIVAGLALLLVPSIGHGQGLEGWSLQPSEAVVYRVERTGPDGETSTGRRILFASDLVDGRLHRSPVWSLEDIVCRYVLTYPDARIRDGARWGQRESFDRIGDAIGPRATVEGRFEAQALGDGQLRIAGRLAIEARAGGSDLRLASARVRTDAVWVEPGVLREVEWTIEEVPVDPGDGPEVVERSGRLVDPEIVDLASDAFGRRVNEAIDRGSERLRDQMNVDRLAGQDQGLGKLSLGLLALQRAGVGADDPTVEAALEAIGELDFTHTYSVSLYILAIEAKSVELVETDGTRRRYGREPPSIDDLRRLEDATDWLVRSREEGNGIWDYTGEGAEDERRPPGRGDHSNTQFAVLALQAAETSGVPVPTEVWREIADHFVETQEPGGPSWELDVAPAEDDEADGEARGGTRARCSWGGRAAGERGGRREARGWAYGTGRAARPETAYGSMSCAGLSSLMIAEAALRRADALDDRRAARIRESLLDGLAWMERAFTVRHHPYRGSRWYHYYLYSLEKVGELGEIGRFGDHHWYREGALQLLEAQRDRGGWGRFRNTALALLFLTRATLTTDVELAEAGRVATGEDREGRVWVDGVGLVRAADAIRALGGRSSRRLRERLEVARAVLDELPPDERPIIVPALCEVLAARPPRPVRSFGGDALEEATGERLRSPDDYLAWHERWEALREPAGWDEVREEAASALAGENPRMREAACRGILDIGADEAAGTVLDALAEVRGVDARRRLADTLRSLTGVDPGYDPTAPRREREEALETWRARWEERRTRTDLAEQVEEHVEGLDSGNIARAADASDALEEIGEPAVPLLIEAMREPGAPREDIGWVLRRITGEDHGLDPAAWTAWWEREGSR